MAELIRTVPHDHPALPGHFPGTPVLPGVVLLDWAWEACAAALPAGARLAGVQSAKFLRAALPGDVLRLACTASTATQADFAVLRREADGSDTIIAQGRFLHG